MTIEFAKRVAAEILGRGQSSIRINPSAVEDVKKAMTREDVRQLVKDGKLVAIKAKHNVSRSSKLLKIRRAKGRGRGPGTRKGTRKTRQGDVWMKRSRSQRTLLKNLRSSGKIDKAGFNKYYMLVKGNAFPDKASLVLHIREDGVSISEQEMTAMKEKIRADYKAGR